jgi:hypothetical protein
MVLQTRERGANKKMAGAIFGWDAGNPALLHSNYFQQPITPTPLPTGIELYSVIT